MASQPERPHTQHSIAAFVLLFVVLMLPVELMVRASERMYGPTTLFSTPLPRSLSPKIDEFVAGVEKGTRFSTLIGGTSRAECGIRPDILRNMGFGPTFNLGVSGSSSLAVFRIARAANVRPARLLISVSPLDLMVVGAKNADRAAERAQSVVAEARRRRSIAGMARRATWRVFHSAASDRHRSLTQWAELFRDGGDVMKFLSNDEAVRAASNVTFDGYTAPRTSAPESGFDHIAVPRGFNSYTRDRLSILASYREEIDRYRGTTAIILVRIPVSAAVRHAEDLETTFDADIRSFASAEGVRYIDGQDLVADSFVTDHRNFSDGGHLNYDGAAVFSQALAAALRNGSN